MARKVDQTLEMHELKRKFSQNGDTLINFAKMSIMKIFFTCIGMGVRMKSSVALLKPVKMIMNVQNAREVTMKVKSGYVVQYVINGTMKSVFL